MTSALTDINRKTTAQTEQATPTQVENSAGGFVFEVSDKSRLERFLIIGTDGGTYYASEKAITKDNAAFVTALIQKNEALVRETLVDISVNARAYKQSPVLFTLALLLADGKDKAATRAVFNSVVRTSTQLFEVAQYIENLTGWGRAKRGAVADWYTAKSDADLAYQLVKYRQRNGWTHRDLMRLSHPTGINPNIGNFALGKEHRSHEPIIAGFTKMQSATALGDVLMALEEYPSLPWETIPTDLLKDAKVWKKLFYNNQLNGQALVRNITRLARLNAFDDMVFAHDYAAKLADEEMIVRTKLHPMNYLLAVSTHQNGQADRNSYGGLSKDWKESSVIVDALNEGFHLAFKTINPANKRTFIGLDVSGSMESTVMGTSLSARDVSAAIAMTIARTEPYCETRGFSTEFVDLGITPKMDLSTVIKKISNLPFARTDCAIPMEYALKNKIEVDTFIIITDNETYAGRQHPFQALKAYRQGMGIDAKLMVMATTATPFTIADPSDPGMLDFVGFDASAPRVMADFSAGRI